MTDATVEKVPYRGISFVGIPEFAGSTTVDGALEKAQASTDREMREAGYLR